MFCRLLFVLLSFFFWPLCCLFFLDIQILITPLVSSNSSNLNNIKTRKNCFRYLKLVSPLNVMAWARKYYLKTIIWPWDQRSRSHKGHYSMRHTALWSCTHIPNIIDLPGKAKKLWSGQALLRRSRRCGRKNQTKTICLPSFEGKT